MRQSVDLPQDFPDITADDDGKDAMTQSNKNKAARASGERGDQDFKHDRFGSLVVVVLVVVAPSMSRLNDS